MKKLAVAVLFFLVCSCSENNNAESPNKGITFRRASNDLRLGGLKGKIKSLTENDYKIIDQSGVVQKKLMDKTISIYNESGNQLESVFYNEHETIDRTEKYKYDAIGQKKEMDKFNADGAFMGKSICHSDTIGNNYETVSYTANDSFQHKEMYKYDCRNNLIEVRFYYPNEKLYWRISNKYDDSCNCTEVTHYDVNDSVASHFELQFEGMRKIVGTKYYSYGKLEDETTKFEDFDEAENWLKETIFLKGKPVRRIERQIEYYR
jgi:hypothetical protein